MNLKRHLNSGVQCFLKLLNAEPHKFRDRAAALENTHHQQVKYGG